MTCVKQRGREPLGSILLWHGLLTLAFFNTEGIKSPEESEYDRVSLKKNPLQPANIEEFDTMLEFLFIEPPSVPGPVKKYLFKGRDKI